MRPLTDSCPKPLLPVRGKPLMQWAMEALQRGGVRDLVINTAWLGEQIPAHFGEAFVGAADASQPMQLHYSEEGVDFGGALETAGGVVRALPHLAETFWVAAGDVFAPDFEYSPDALARFEASNDLAHLWLVPNPAHNPGGDFGCSINGRALNLPKPSQPNPIAVVSAAPASSTLGTPASPNLQPVLYTFSTIALYKRAFFEAAWCPIPVGNPTGIKAALAPMLRAAMDQDLVGASLYTGAWTDVGTPERLAQLNQGHS